MVYHTVAQARTFDSELRSNLLIHQLRFSPLNKIDLLDQATEAPQRG